MISWLCWWLKKRHFILRALCTILSVQVQNYDTFFQRSIKVSTLYSDHSTALFQCCLNLYNWLKSSELHCTETTFLTLDQWCWHILPSLDVLSTRYTLWLILILHIMDNSGFGNFWVTAFCGTTIKKTFYFQSPQKINLEGLLPISSRDICNLQFLWRSAILNNYRNLKYTIF